MGILTWSICAIIFGVPSVQGATLRGSSVGNNVVERNHHHRHLDEAVCENAVTGKFKVKGQSTARKCGGFANKNLCENELNDGTGNKVFEVCAKSCDACGTAPTSAPTQFEDNKIECENEKVGKFKVIGVKGKKACSGFANNGYCNNDVHQNAGGGKVFEACRKSCNACGIDLTNAPTSSPTALPSSTPSTAPSAAPSVAPSAGPSESPSSRPTPTTFPTGAPTEDRSFSLSPSPSSSEESSGVSSD